MRHLEGQPPYKPLHPLLSGVANVKGSKDIIFNVDLDTGVCSCVNGGAFEWRVNAQKWDYNRLCTHKLKIIASAIDNAKNDTDRDDLTRFYWKNLSKRYIIWESVSAFHKELRRGDVEASKYWAMMVAGHRGTHGVIRYLLNIMFEETRDIPLYTYILGLDEKGKLGVTLTDMLNAVERFAIAPKKWEIAYRQKVFVNEMAGYKSLATDYGYEVAKGKDIIDGKAMKKLTDALLQGFATADPILLQVGVKGLFKMKSADHHKHKLFIFNLLTDVLNEEYPNKFPYNRLYVERLQKLHMRRLRSVNEIGYHELNSFADALAGECPTDDTTVSASKHRAITARPVPTPPPLGVLKIVPAYAQDNHTYRGKALMRSHANELQPGADQIHLDFRMCGAYFGVAWRHLAFAQYGKIDVPFGSVKWNKPTWLFKHINSMWY